MTSKMVIVAMAISALSSFAHADDGEILLETSANSVVFITAAPIITTQGTSYYAGFNKEIIAAQDDITNFVASDGKIRTAQFEHAMGLVRQMNNVQAVHDMELAQAVLAELQ